jgi:hypothetical protein
MTKRRDITARRVRLDSQGYDSSGSYWGNSKPLYWIAFVASDGNEISEMIRATDRRAAVDYAMNIAAYRAHNDALRVKREMARDS